MKRAHRIAIAIAAPAAVGLIYAFGDELMSLTPYLGGCMFHTITGLLCPGCGNTRCVRALLDLDIPLAIRSNATIPFLILCMMCLYAETVIGIFGREVKILPRKPLLWAGVLAAFLIYYVVRNFIPAIAPIG